MKNSQNEKKKEIENSSINIPQLSYNFNISTTVVKYIIEKLISLTISQSLQNKISKQIPSFCFEEVKNALNLALFIDFINYDKDDLTPKKSLLDYASKSYENISKFKKEKILIKNKSEILRKYIFGTELDPNISYEGSINLEVFNSPEKEKDKDKNKMTIKESENNINKNFLLKYIKEEKKEEENNSIKDPNLGKLLNGLIIREPFVHDKKNKNKHNLKSNKLNLLSNELSQSSNNSIDHDKKIAPFEVNGIDTIEKIKNIESHKIDIIPKFTEEKQILNCDKIKDKLNSWSIISQPKVPPIDRDAGTKINFKNFSKFKKMKTLNEPKNENDYSNKKNSGQKKDFNSSMKDSYKSFKSFNKQKSKLISNFSYKKQNEPEENPRRKKYAPLIEFPSEDIDPKILGLNIENSELKKMRENLEKELIEKKLEHARKLQKEREIQALEKAREEKRKELANKNVTVDIKGNIVYIKSLNVNDFTNDFTKMRAKYKEIKTIQNASKTALIQKAIVEKNPLALYEATDKEKPKKKNKKNYYGYKSSKNDDRQQGGNNKPIWIGDRIKDPIYAAGSNFEIMRPECGVILKENEKTKQGGKDFLSKYNKYSVEVFEETLNKTISSNFYSTQRNSIFNPNVNNTGLPLNKSQKKLKTKRIKDENKTEGNINNTNDIRNSISNLLPDIPSENNDRLSVKAKNLKLALNNLDLITENDEKYYLDKKKSKSIIKKKNQFLSDFFKKTKKNYEEINKFAKTLIGNENWGENLLHKKKEIPNFKIPQKPLDIELKRELPLNLLNHLPRKRLPPINMTNRINNELSFGMGFTTVTDGFFKRKRNMKVFLSEENNKKENDKDKNTNINNNNPINNTLQNDDKDNNKDKFNYTSTSGFLTKQLDD